MAPKVRHVHVEGTLRPDLAPDGSNRCRDRELDGEIPIGLDIELAERGLEHLAVKLSHATGQTVVTVDGAGAVLGDRADAERFGQGHDFVAKIKGDLAIGARRLGRHGPASPAE